MDDTDNLIPADAQAGSPASPCIGVCQLNEQQICVGCGRHVVEITAAGVAAERARLARFQNS